MARVERHDYNIWSIVRAVLIASKSIYSIVGRRLIEACHPMHAPNQIYYKMVFNTLTFILINQQWHSVQIPDSMDFEQSNSLFYR